METGFVVAGHVEGVGGVGHVVVGHVNEGHGGHAGHTGREFCNPNRLANAPNILPVAGLELTVIMKIHFSQKYWIDNIGQMK